MFSEHGLPIKLNKHYIGGCRMSEQELIFRMFACEFMGWYQSEKYEYYCFESSELMYRVCDALRCEE